MKDFKDLTNVQNKGTPQHISKECSEVNDGDNPNEQDWSVHAIKYWIRELFKRHPMKAWSIDNYHGQESYTELGMKLRARHWKEIPLEPASFQRMRSHMLAIELEMGDALTTRDLTTKEQERGWNGLKDLVVSICDDYTPEVSHYNTKAMTTDSTRSSHLSEEQFHSHSHRFRRA